MRPGRACGVLSRMEGTGQTVHAPPRGRERAPGEVVREVVRRFAAGESIDAFVAPGYRTAPNGPARPAGVTVHGSPDRQTARMAEAGLRIDVRSVRDAPDDRFLFESVWVNKGTAGGSAGMFWSVMTVEDGLICAEQHFEHEAEARAYAGLGPGD